jgi:hypothetical protein
VKGLRSISGVTADAIGVLPVPPRPKVTVKDTAKVTVKDTAAVSDSAKAKAAPDTTHQSKKPR